MAVAEFPVELILEIASHLNCDGFDNIGLALTCRRTYDILIPGILEGRLQYIRRFMASLQHRHADNLDLVLSSYDGGRDARLEPFGGSYRMLQFHPGDSRKEFLCIQSIIARAQDLDAVHLHLGYRRTTLRILAAIINGCAVRPNLSLIISGTIPNEYHYEYDKPGHNRGGPFKFELLGPTKHIPQSRDPSNKYANMLTSWLKPIPLLIRRSPDLRNPSQISRSQATDPRHFDDESTNPAHIDSETLRNTIAIPLRPTVELSLAPQCQLSSLHIASDDLFLPSFYPFTKNLLNTAGLTKLSLSQLWLNVLAWAEILPALAIPTLRELHIGNVSIAFPDLLKFLGRRCHQSIEVLDFTGNDAIGNVTIWPRSILSRLSSLTARAEYLIPFLQSRNEGSFPALQHLGISALRPPPKKSENELNPVYELILNGRAFASISVDKIANSGMMEWIIMTSEQWPAENSFTELKQLYLDDYLSVSQNLLGIVETWLVRKGEDQTPHFPRFAISNSEEALERFILCKMPNLRYLNISSKKWA